MTRRLPALLASLVLLCSGQASGAGAPPEPDGYRLEDYRAATPATLKGATVLGTADAHALWQKGTAVFIDVLPHPPKPAGLPEGTLWHEPPHQSIAGAAWLPEVGRGELAAETEEYYRRGLAALTAGEHDKPLVIFCKKDCWMSWNAAKRALAFGYHHVFWYPEGVDGWAAAALPLAVLEPRP